MKVIITYDIIKDGYFVESGWDNEDGVDMTPDKFDVEDGLSKIDVTVGFLMGKFICYASSSHFHKGIYYSDRQEACYETGQTKKRSYHLKDFTEDEELEIYNKVKEELYRRGM